MEEYIEPSLSDVIVVSYEGERDLAGRMHGQGQATMDDGGFYSGGFKDGLFHGRGSFSWADGTKYEGSFSLGMVSNYSSQVCHLNGYYVFYLSPPLILYISFFFFLLLDEWNWQIFLARRKCLRGWRRRWSSAWRWRLPMQCWTGVRG